MAGWLIALPLAIGAPMQKLPIAIFVIEGSMWLVKKSTIVVPVAKDSVMNVPTLKDPFRNEVGTRRSLCASVATVLDLLQQKQCDPNLMMQLPQLKESPLIQTAIMVMVEEELVIMEMKASMREGTVDTYV